MFELVRKNRNRSIWLVAVMMVLLAGVGFAAGELIEPGTGAVGLALAVAVGVVMFLVSFYSGGSVLLMSAGAREVAKEDAPQLYNVVEEMVIASGLGKMPRVYIIESSVANAFATGRNPEVAAVAVTEGLLGMLSREELQAVIAHEIAHVRNRDILFMTLLAVMAGAISIISYYVTRYFLWFGGGRRRSRSSSSGGGGQAELILFIVGLALVVIGAIVARIVFFAASRTREYLADAGGAIFTRNPEALARALEKISGSVAGNKLPVPKVAQAMLIVGAPLFETHPPIEKRVSILRRLAGAGSLSYQRYAGIFEQVTGTKARFMPRSALAERPVQAGVAGLAASTAVGGTPAARAPAPGAVLRREALDAVKKRAGYEVVPCACGARIKIPADYPRRDRIRCLSCGRPLGAAAATAAATRPESR